jgi:hypothetical protein
MSTVITAAHLVTPVEWIESPIVAVEDGHITAVNSRSAMETPAGRLLDFPGLIFTAAQAGMPWKPVNPPWR